MLAPLCAQGTLSQGCGIRGQVASTSYAPSLPCKAPATPTTALVRGRSGSSSSGSSSRSRPSVCTGSSSSASFSGSQPEEEPDARPEGMDYQTFPRLRERNPYKLLGLSKDASFEEVQSARNFLYEQYRWHEPSRESIELAFEAILKDTYKARKRKGFRPPFTGGRGNVRGEPEWSFERRVRNLFDPTVTGRTIINEGVVYAGLALWTLFSSDQSFPLAGAYAYSVYRFQSKRIKSNPEGPHFGGNAIVGAVLTTTINIALACAAMSLVTAPLAQLLDSSMRQVGGFLVILVAGVLGVYLK